MKLTFVIILTLITLFGCNKEKAKSKNKVQNTQVSSNKVESESNDNSSQITEDIEDDSELNFIIIVDEGYNYDSLKKIGLKTAELLNFKFDTLGRYYNPKKGIVLPDNYDDDIWAGEYFFRRTGGDVVSIEMRHVYIDTSIINNKIEREKLDSDTTRMFVFAMMYPEKSKADSLAKIIRPIFPKTKVIAADIYMGCMH